MSPSSKFTRQEMKFETCKDRKIMVEIFCTCRIPWRKAGNNVCTNHTFECSKSNG